MAETVKLMLADRLQGAPQLRQWNRGVSPALEAIVRRCLEPEPDKRYQTARELQEDLQRQLQHRPLKHTREPSLRERLRKFARRHPRLTSSTTVASLSLSIVVGLSMLLFAGRERLRTLDARSQYSAHQAEVYSIQVLLDERTPSPTRLDEGLQRCAGELSRYGIALDGPTPAWERDPKVSYLQSQDRVRLRENVGELFYLMSRAAVQKAERTEDARGRNEFLSAAQCWNELAEAYSGDRLPRALREQKADLLKMKGEAEAARQLREQLNPPQTPRDHYLLGHWKVKQGQYREALPHLRQATQEDPESFSAWFVRGNAHAALGQPEMAVACFSACISLRKEFAPAWYNRGLAYAQMRFHADALDDFGRAIDLQPDLVSAYIERAVAQQGLGRWEDSLNGLTQVLGIPGCPTRVYFLRAHTREKLGDREGARADRAEGLRAVPTDEISYIARAENRLDDPETALADVEGALKINPLSMFGLQLKAHILSERLKKPDPAGALAALNRAVELYPDYVPARAGRGVLLARQGKRGEALRDARESLLRDTKAPNLYQVAGIYALTSKQEPQDQMEALRLLAAALRSGFGLDLVDHDHDFDPIRNDGEFRRIVAHARATAGN